jgi:hypothetical protein
MIDLAEDGVLPNVAPDLVSYNSMLSTIARAKSQQQDVLEKAEHWMKELVQTATTGNQVPSVVTYRALFQIIACSKIQDKSTRARFWLEQCTDEAVKRDVVLLKKIQDMEEGIGRTMNNKHGRIVL